MFLGMKILTFGAVTGGLAGIYYGYASIPDAFIKRLARYEDLQELFEKFAEMYAEDSKK